jgi:hypothetical protein
MSTFLLRTIVWQQCRTMCVWQQCQTLWGCGCSRQSAAIDVGKNNTVKNLINLKLFKKKKQKATLWPVCTVKLLFDNLQKLYTGEWLNYIIVQIEALRSSYYPKQQKLIKIYYVQFALDIVFLPRSFQRTKIIQTLRQDNWGSPDLEECKSELVVNFMASGYAFKTIDLWVWTC